MSDKHWKSSYQRQTSKYGGYGLEIPCEYQFIGDAFSINWLKEGLQKEGFNAQ